MRNFFSYYLHTIFTLILQLSASLIHIHGKSFPIQFDSFCPSPDTRHETKKTLNSVIYRKRKESERKMMVAMRLGFIEIELSQQNFVPPIGNNFFASESQCVHGAKKFILFFCSVHIFLINAALLLRSSIFDAKISHFAA